jgi:hypothetical protein
MSEQLNYNRRRFLATAAITIAAGPLVVLGSEDGHSPKAKPADVTPIKPETNISFGIIKQINAGLLDVGYAESGPANGPVVMLLHGWPMIFTALQMLRPY